jgi:hypothetical protein
MTITILFDKINWSKVTKQGFELLMEMCLAQEDYLKAAKVIDELKKRNSEPTAQECDATGTISQFTPND